MTESEWNKTSAKTILTSRVILNHPPTSAPSPPPSHQYPLTTTHPPVHIVLSWRDGHTCQVSRILAGRIQGENCYYWFSYVLMWLIRPILLGWAQIWQYPSCTGSGVSCGGRGSELWLLKFRQTRISSIFRLTSMDMAHKLKLEDVNWINLIIEALSYYSKP